MTVRRAMPASATTSVTLECSHCLLRRDEGFCAIGQVRYEIGIVEKGLLQVYTLSDRHESVVLDFLFPGDFAIALESAMSGAPSPVGIRALYPSVVKVQPFSLLADEPSMDRELKERAIASAFARLQHRFFSLRLLNADQRYRQLDKEFPPSWRSIPQRLLASYLGVTPQYLCRLTQAS